MNMTMDPEARAEAAFQRALALHRQGSLDEARNMYQEALQMQPQHRRCLHLLGVLAAQSNHLDRAVEFFGRAIAIQPDSAEAYLNRGIVLREAGQPEAAIEDLERAIALQPGNAGARIVRAHAFRDLGQYEASLESLDEAIALAPDQAELHNNRGCALRELGRHEAAIASLDRAITLNPDYKDAHYNRGLALSEQRQFHEAIASYDQAIALDSQHVAAHNNRALALRELRRYEEAVEGLQSALALAPDFAEAHRSLGLAYFDLEQFERAAASHEKAIALKHDYAEAHSSRGNALLELKRYAPAIESYDAAIALGGDANFLHGLRLHAKLQIGDWNDWDAQLRQVENRIALGERASPPFHTLALTDAPALQRRAAELWVREQCPANFALAAIPRRDRREKIRIGYFSADFRSHPVSTLTAELFEIHDRSRFEVIAFSLGPDTQDPMRKRLEKAFDRFIDVRSNSDQEIASLARSLEIDIAVDLGGFTHGGRPQVFAMRAAPLQTSYLGYSGTMGADYIDYLIADSTLIPPASQHHYREKVVYLPYTYMVNDSTREIADRVFSRRELGLPPSGFVYCCFNNGYKIAPDCFDSWMRILRQVQGSVLWLSEGAGAAAANLRREALRRGVSAERLIFGQRMPSLAEHLARQRAADLFLDTLPYNAHATTCDALWAGLPVLTCAGESFAGRVAASLLQAIDLPEMVAATKLQYVQLAVELGGDLERLARIKQRLADNRLRKPLFDTALFVSHLESAYEAIYARYHAGLPIEHVYVRTDAPAAAPPVDAQ